MPGWRLQIQYLASAVPSRWKSRSRSSREARSTAPATRIMRTVAASDSSARSAKTLRINGLSISLAPNAERWRTWWAVNPVVGAGAVIHVKHADLVLRTVCVAAIVGALVLRYFYVQFHWQQRVASEAQ